MNSTFRHKLHSMPIATTPRKPQHLLLRFIERIPSAELVTNIRRVGKKNRQSPEEESSTEFKDVSTCSRHRKGVTFGTSVKVRPCMPLDDYTDEEHFNSWYIPEEMQLMKRERKAVVRHVENDMKLPSMTTFRGLEGRTKMGDLEKGANRLAGLMSVINAQARQRLAGECDDEAIGMAYHHSTKHCWEKARQLAQQDAEEAKTC